MLLTLPAPLEPTTPKRRSLVAAEREPTSSKIIRVRLLIETKRRRGHDELAREGMRHEAEIVLEALPEAFEAAGLRLVTKHDAIYVRVEDADRARDLFSQVLAEAGVRAVVR